jgi:apolipoprotein N-acyltransferase
VLTGFPWNAVGYSWVDVPTVAQATALVGIFGLGLATLLVVLVPAAWFGGQGSRRAGRLGTGAAFLLAAAIVGFGAHRLADAEAGFVPNVMLRLVQPNIAQTMKLDRSAVLDTLHRLQALSAQPSANPSSLTAVIWPETAVPFALTTDPDARAAVARSAPPGGLLITGALRVSRPAGATTDTPVDLFNALAAVDADAAVVASYDKAHLVPFGEYVPLRRFLPFGQIVPGGRFTPGPGPRTVDLPGLPPASPLICYEVIFPGAVVDETHRPSWLLNVTNDGWFGNSAGPRQHFAMARMRAVEEGLPLVRVANTGISAVVDPWGRVQARLALGESGVLDQPLPVAVSSPPLYTWWGDLPTLLIVFSILGLAFLTGKTQQNRD